MINTAEKWKFASEYKKVEDGEMWQNSQGRVNHQSLTNGIKGKK